MPETSHAAPVEPPAPTIAELRTRHATLRPAAVRLVFRGYNAERSLELGQSIATEVVLRDGPRFVDAVDRIWAALSPTRRALVVGYSALMPAVVVAELAELDRIHASFADGAAEGTLLTLKRRAALREGFGNLVAHRSQTVIALRDLLGSDHPAMAALAEALAPATDPEAVARSAELTADTLATLRRDTPDADDRSLLDEVGLSDARVVSLRDEAAALRRIAAVASASVLPQVAAQRSLDDQDGRVIHCVGYVYRRFREAQRLDSTLVLPDLGAFSRFFIHRGGRTTPSTPAKPTPTPA